MRRCTMRNLFFLCVLFIICNLSVCDVIKPQNISVEWGKTLMLNCQADALGRILVTSAKFGHLDEKGGSSCFINVGKHIRAKCNYQSECIVEVILGPVFPNREKIHCTTDKPKLYVNYKCLSLNNHLTTWKKASFERDIARFIMPPVRSTNDKTTWKAKDFDLLCNKLPKYIHFEIMDIFFMKDCTKQKLIVSARNRNYDKKYEFCQSDIDEVSEAKRSFGFSNFTQVSFELITSVGLKKKPPVVLKYAMMYCNPIKNVPNNTRLEYYAGEFRSIPNPYALVTCKNGFLPWPGTPSEVKIRCGTDCYFPDECDTKCSTWSSSMLHTMRAMRCVTPSALTTTTSTTTTTTTATTTITTTDASTSAEASTSTITTTEITIPPSTKPNRTVVIPGIVKSSPRPSPISTSAPVHEVPKKKTSEPQIVAVAGIIGGVAGFMVCLLMGVLIWMICRRSRMCSCCRWWCCRCLDGFFMEKSDLSRTQSHLVGSVDDSTMAVRYRVPTMSTGLDATSVHSNNNRSSVAASSTMGSLPFSYRRNKKKPVHPLPHPSQLGYGPFDEMAPLCNENGGHAWSPSIETYLEPNRRPSASSMGAMGGGRRHHEMNKFSTFHPKQRSDADYQEYDETRSSRNALDRFDGPHFDPRRSQALQSNHYYCRGDNSVSSDDVPMKDLDCESLYESVDDVISSVSSGGGSPRGARRFPAAMRNEYVQPPALPARPPGLDRSSRYAPPVIPVNADEDEDGYQPVNVKGRVNV